MHDQFGAEVREIRVVAPLSPLLHAGRFERIALCTRKLLHDHCAAPLRDVDGFLLQRALGENRVARERPVLSHGLSWSDSVAGECAGGFDLHGADLLFAHASRDWVVG